MNRITKLKNNLQMNNKELQAETEAQQSKNAELFSSAPLVANPLLADGLYSESISFKIQRDNPKPNAKNYHIETVQDIANAVTQENITRFLEDLEMCLQSHFLVKTIAECQTGDDGESVGLKILFPSFEWIDD